MVALYYTLKENNRVECFPKTFTKMSIDAFNKLEWWSCGNDDSITSAYTVRTANIINLSGTLYLLLFMIMIIYTSS